jgi:hypothetical protein
MHSKLILFNFRILILPEEEEIMNKTTKLVGLHFLDVHARVYDHRFK